MITKYEDTTEVRIAFIVLHWNPKSKLTAFCFGTYKKGIWVRDRTVLKPSFSEREGYKKYLDIGTWRVTIF